MASPAQRAKRPVTLLAGTYGHPIHPMLVTVPIGAWVASLAFDVASLVVPEPFLTPGATWLIAIGVLGALAAAMAGLLDLLAIPAGTAAHRIALIHMSLNLVAIAVFAAAFWWRRTAAEGASVTGGGMIALSAAGLVLLAVAGFLGGRLAYHYGVRVADEQTQALGFQQGGFKSVKKRR